MSEEGKTKTAEEIAAEVMKEPEVKKEEEPKKEEEIKDEEKKEEIKEEPKKEEEEEEKSKEEEPKKEEKKEEESKKEDEDVKKVTEEYDKISSRFAALSRKEKALRRREQEIEEKLKRYAELEDLEKIAKDDPAAALEKIGLTQEQLVKFMVDGDKPELKKLDKIAKELEETKAKLNQYETKSKAEKKEFAVSNFKSNIADTIKSDNEKYELLNLAEDSVEIIYEIINQDVEAKVEEAKREGYEIDEEFLQTIKPMPIEAAANLAEKYLEEEAIRLNKAKKFAPKPKEEPKAEPKSKKETSKSEPEKKEVTPEPNTLTNRMVSQTPEKKSTGDRFEDVEAVKKEFKGKLFDIVSDE